MYADWIFSSNGLPHQGQQIEFLLDFRNVAMNGTYIHQAFRSHWAEYDVARVRSWRNLTEVCDLATPPRSQAKHVLSNVSCQDTSYHPLPIGGLAHAT